MAMVFSKSPNGYMNPLIPIQRQLAETFAFTVYPLTNSVFESSWTALASVDPDRVLRAYPHELGGGMLQRVMIAMASDAQARAAHRRRAPPPPWT